MIKYKHVSGWILNDIKEGKIKVGDTMPSLLVLSKQCKASILTIRAAIRHLEKNGCVFRVVNHRYRVLVAYHEPLDNRALKFYKPPFKYSDLIGVISDSQGNRIVGAGNKDGQGEHVARALNEYWAKHGG